MPQCHGDSQATERHSKGRLGGSIVRDIRSYRRVDAGVHDSLVGIWGLKFLSPACVLVVGSDVGRSERWPDFEGRAKARPRGLADEEIATVRIVRPDWNARLALRDGVPGGDSTRYAWGWQILPPTFRSMAGIFLPMHWNGAPKTCVVSHPACRSSKPTRQPAGTCPPPASG